MAKATCSDCNRNVIMVRIGGELVATESELIMVVPAQRKTYQGDMQERTVMASSTTYARQLHAARCADYVEQARKQRIAGEMRAFNERQARAGRAARKNRGL